jgi:hypothetical protein
LKDFSELSKPFYAERNIYSKNDIRAMLNGSSLSNSRARSEASYGALWIKIWPARKFNITRCDVRIYKFINFLQVQTVTRKKAEAE